MTMYNRTTIEQSGNNARTSAFANFNMTSLENAQKNMNESIEANKISTSFRLNERSNVAKPMKQEDAKNLFKKSAQRLEQKPSVMGATNGKFNPE